MRKVFNPSSHLGTITKDRVMMYYQVLIQTLQNLKAYHTKISVQQLIWKSQQVKLATICLDKCQSLVKVVLSSKCLTLSTRMKVIPNIFFNILVKRSYLQVQMAKYKWILCLPSNTKQRQPLLKWDLKDQRSRVNFCQIMAIVWLNCMKAKINSSSMNQWGIFK